jgi:hypothetical protein
MRGTLRASITAAIAVSVLFPFNGSAQGRRGGQQAHPNGTLTPMTPDSRGWGWQVKASISPDTPRPFYNRAKELLFQDKQVTSYTISRYEPEFYCEVAKHFDFVWFEMQHSTMSWDEVAKMIAACPSRRGANDSHARCA